jgi:peptidoglycan/xylan/chitin deacetylase (PgdA/CDA1 family)
MFFAVILISCVLFSQSGHASSETAYDKFSAVIIAYQHIGEDSFPDTNIRIEQFQAHIRELVSGDYNILPLEKVVKSFQEQTPLPMNSVAITFDGGYRSVYNHAIPLLLEHDIPFTIFLSTDNLDHNSSRYMNWDDIKKLKKHKKNNLISIEAQPMSYVRLSDSSEEDIRQQINSARALFRKNIGTEVSLFSYPFGEYSSKYRNIIASAGFKAAFGLQSGVAYSGSDIMALPRFTMTENYGGLERFRMIAKALPLPATDIKPENPRLDNNNPAIGFSIDKSLMDDRQRLKCFASNHSLPKIEFIGTNRVELRFEKAFDDQRTRINCTMPGPDSEPGEEQKWRWFGMLLTMKASIQAQLLQQ